ncbi:lipoate-protein ligase A [Desulfohalotomaculum tongense]|uniref:lipoate--protein ligase family protein n=1 Tax=Desulforadius tongensis TaxID=1216062 RepID=UPI00195BF3FC|nr:lipoate--protein ligase family protein [Desulforadius tongensis]MBM7854328.1 lipoate-protein ligase A [Desulforadius tongensis]
MKETAWRFIETDPLDAYTNMAVDHAILESVAAGKSPPTIRFYRWHPPGITIGYFQKINKEIDLEACRRKGIDVVRRLTGGRAVLHRHELTYSVIAPENHPQVAGTILQSYLAISRGLLAGLKNLGVEGRMVEGAETHRQSTAACFDAPSWYELVVNGKKLVGSAQTRKRGVLLQHGSVLIKADDDLLFSLLNFSSEQVRRAARKRFAGKATCLAAEMNYQPPFHRVAEAFKAGFMEGLEIQLFDGELTGLEKKRAGELVDSQYRTRQWNYKR